MISSLIINFMMLSSFHDVITSLIDVFFVRNWWIKCRNVMFFDDFIVIKNISKIDISIHQISVRKMTKFRGFWPRFSGAAIHQIGPPINTLISNAPPTKFSTERVQNLSGSCVKKKIGLEKVGKKWSRFSSDFRQKIAKKWASKSTDFGHHFGPDFRRKITKNCEFFGPLFRSFFFTLSIIS